MQVINPTVSDDINQECYTTTNSLTQTPYNYSPLTDTSQRPTALNIRRNAFISMTGTSPIFLGFDPEVSENSNKD